MVKDNETTASLCKIRTRLNKFSEQEQGQLINWGYALTNAAMRRHVLPSGSDVMIGTWPTPEHAL
jgi:NTE family protein